MLSLLGLFAGGVVTMVIGVLIAMQADKFKTTVEYTEEDVYFGNATTVTRTVTKHTVLSIVLLVVGTVLAAVGMYLLYSFVGGGLAPWYVLVG